MARTVEDLPEKSFGEFKKVLGNNEVATKSWLLWAERSGLIVKGFRLDCSGCGGRQWTPVAAFLPPIVCRGCAETMAEPFGDRHTTTFMYRLSERLRRVYEHDAIGHLLTMRYFDALIGSGSTSVIVGMHPGMDILKRKASKTEGEADVVILLRNGDFIPVEVKRSFSSMTSTEVDKLDHLVDLLGAPWSALAVCGYGKDVSSEYRSYERRGDSTSPYRVLLSYDALLDPQVVWGMGMDPFEWKPLSDLEIAERENAFVERLVNKERDGYGSWMEWEFTRELDASD